MNKTSIAILLAITLVTGCSLNEQMQKPFLSEEQKAELKDILDRNLTDQDWDRYQHRYQQAMDRVKEILDKEKHNKEKLNIEYIDLRNDYDKNLPNLMIIMAMCSDKPELAKELSSFVSKLLPEPIPKHTDDENTKDIVNKNLNSMLK